MILCELKDSKVLGYELVPDPEKVREFKKTQMNDTLKVFSAVANSTKNTMDNVDPRNQFFVNFGEHMKSNYHLLSMYPFVNTYKSLYLDAYQSILNGGYDYKSIFTFKQRMELDAGVTLTEERHLILDSYYVHTTGEVKEPYYRAEKVVEINAYLHYLLLLLRKRPDDFAKQQQLFHFTKEEIAMILSNFKFEDIPCFESEVGYLEKMNSINDYNTLADASDKVLKLVRSTM